MLQEYFDLKELININSEIFKPEKNYNLLSNKKDKFQFIS